MNNKGISSFKIAGAFIGTVIGAGFATGQEILQFFVKFREKGLPGIIIVTVLFIIFGNIIMQLGYRLNSKSHIEVIKHSSGNFLGSIIDYIITFFLFGALTVMLAGTGALVLQQFNISSIWGSLFMAILAGITVAAGLDGVVTSISFLVPFLIISTVGISIWSLFVVPTQQNALLTSLTVNELIQNWVVSSILYVSYNILLSVAILAPIGANAIDRNAIRKGSIMAGIALGVGSASIYLALMKYSDIIANAEVPMTFIAGLVSPIIQIVYIIALIVAIYTTAVGSLFGFISRIEAVKPINKNALIIIVLLVALLGSQFGFSILVKYLYSIVGYGGLVLLASLLFVQFKKSKSI